MPDLTNYSVTRLANASISVPRWQITGQIADSKDHNIIIADITAANVIFPNVLSNLTTAQQDDWVNSVVRELIFKRFGLS